MTLRGKTFLPLALLSGAFLSFLYGFWFPRSLANLEEQELRADQRQLESVAQGLIPLLLAHQLDAVYENLDVLLRQNQDWVSIRLIDPEGKPLYPLRDAAPRGSPPGTHVLEFPMKLLGQDLGRVALTVDLSPVLAAAEHRHRQLVTALLLVICGFFGSVAFVVERVVRRPVGILARAAERVAQGDFDAAIEKRGHDEVGNLVDSFNRMRVAIRDNQASLRAAAVENSRIRHHLKSIIDSMPSLLAGVDQEGRTTEWNAQAEVETGVPSDAAIGQPLDMALPWLATQMDGVRFSMKTGKPHKVEKVLHEAKGEMRYSDVMIYPLAGEGVTGAVVRVDDVTERVRIEQLMVQTEKIMAVGGIAAGVAHEINNPLGGVLQGAQNISRRVSNELPRNAEVALECGTSLSAIQAYLERRGILPLLEGIRESGDRAARIVADMLQFSRPSQLHTVPIDLAACLERMVALATMDYDLKKKYDFRKIEIVREFDPGLGDVPCIPTQIELVILNLLKNAAQAMHTDQSADSTVPPRITLRTRADGAMARIEIEDNGPGLDEATRRRVFEPFFTTKAPGSGTGLGLSVSYFIIVELHRGELSVESEPGRGARFVIRIPFSRGQQ